MDANELIEQGKAKARAKAEAERIEEEARKRKYAAAAQAEMDKFMREAIEPIRAACGQIAVGDMGEINSRTWEKSIDLVVPLCVTVEVEFELLPGCHGRAREESTWTLKRYLVPAVVLDKGADECEKPWSARMVFWRQGYLEATATHELDEAFALASERFIEWMALCDEADRRNKFDRIGREAREEQEQKRAAAELAAFRPFVFYQVTYGIVADEDGARYADTSHFDSLRDAPTGDGYWLTVQGKEIHIVHWVTVERIHVVEAADLPVWCPLVKTEWGNIRVPPEIDSLRSQ
jgi:hypothetical protein